MEGGRLLAMTIARVGCLPSADLRSYREGPQEAVSTTGIEAAPEPSLAELASTPEPSSAAVDAEQVDTERGARPAALDPGEPEAAVEPGPPGAGAVASGSLDDSSVEQEVRLLP
jgi:hypothetical protein